MSNARATPRKRRAKRLTREEQKAQTRTRLIDAAGRVFVRRGFEAASVEEITAEAGYTRGAFYSNFEGKEQLFFEVLFQRAYAEYTRMIERFPLDAEPREQMRHAGEELESHYERGEERGETWLAGLWLECLALAARDERFRELASGFWRQNRELVEQNIRDYYEQRGKKPPIDPNHLAISATALDIGIFLQHLVDPERVPLDLYPKLFESVLGHWIDPRT
jgi:AcrR family transcriptional regulator